MDGQPPLKRRCIAPKTDSRNISHHFRQREYSGKGYKRFSEVRRQYITQYGKQTESTDILDIIVSLESYLHNEQSTPKTLYKNCKALFECVTCLERRNADEVERYEREDANAERFHTLGGLETAKRIIMFESVLPKNSPNRHEADELILMKSVLFEALGRIISADSVGETIAKELGSDDDFLVHMFHYLQFDQTFLSACSLIEDCLQNRPTLRLSEIPNLQELMTRFDDPKLMNFCRILVICVSELDIFSNNVSLYAQNKQKRSAGYINVRDLNQEYLLGIPGFVDRLIAVACSKDYAPRYRGLTGEVENWMQWIDDSNSDDLLDMPFEDTDMLDFVAGLSQPSEPDAPWIRQPGMECINKLVYKVEALYAIGLLLLGKNRKRGQKIVAQKGLIPGLSTLFENFIWRVQGNRTGPRNRLAGHNASCECSPEVAVKLQFLRLVHSFSDHSEHNHLLLSKSELQEVRRINEKAHSMLQVQELSTVDVRNMCRGKEGLVTKMVEVLKKEPTASTYRFWLSRSLESFLRGKISYCDQVFLLRRGLLQHIVNFMLDNETSQENTQCSFDLLAYLVKNNIEAFKIFQDTLKTPEIHIVNQLIDNENMSQEITQCNFDLLAEIVKLNIEAFKIIEDVLKTPEIRKKFIGYVNSGLVDSNMFIRSIILSYGFFINELTEHAGYARKVNYILSYIGDFQHQVNYLHELITFTGPRGVCQENISCLNTTIVLLMTAIRTTGNNDEALVPYLKALKAEQVTYEKADKKGGNQVMNNFRDLLLFWKDHYLAKDKDCSGLERTSRIKFAEWKNIVEKLLDSDSSKDTSLSHYIGEDEDEEDEFS